MGEGGPTCSNPAMDVLGRGPTNSLVVSQPGLFEQWACRYLNGGHKPVILTAYSNMPSNVSHHKLAYM